MESTGRKVEVSAQISALPNSYRQTNAATQCQLQPQILRLAISIEGVSLEWQLREFKGLSPAKIKYWENFIVWGLGLLAVQLEETQRFVLQSRKTGCRRLAGLSVTRMSYERVLLLWLIGKFGPGPRGAVRGSLYILYYPKFRCQYPPYVSQGYVLAVKFHSPDFYFPTIS
jgi:hypothetical protein